LAGEPPDMSAAELALGVLDGDERVAALRRQLADPAFAREVGLWREQLDVLAENLPGAAPPPNAFARIEAALQPRAPDRARRWQIATMLASLAAAACLLVLVLRPPPEPRVIVQPAPAILVAQLAPAGKPVRLAAAYDPALRRLRITRTGARLAGAARGEQLWLIRGSAAPRSLGMIGDRGAVLQLGTAESALIDDGVTLAVSIEPPGGSPTGSPTGPVVATGTVTRI
jgi:anti-sigma-K factor RskA